MNPLFLAQVSQQPDPLKALLYTLLLPVGIMFFIFYFMIIRPQRRKEHERKELLASIKKDDHVVTIGGIHGVVTAVRETDVTIKVDETKDVRIRVSRSAISSVVSAESGTGQRET